MKIEGKKLDIERILAEQREAAERLREHPDDWFAAVWLADWVGEEIEREGGAYEKKPPNIGRNERIESEALGTHEMNEMRLLPISSCHSCKYLRRTETNDLKITSVLHHFWCSGLIDGRGYMITEWRQIPSPDVFPDFCPLPKMQAASAERETKTEMSGGISAADDPGTAPVR